MAQIAYWTMDVTFWWLLSVLKDRVIVILPLAYEPSAKALVFLGLDVEAILSNDWYFSYRSESFYSCFLLVSDRDR